MAATSSGGSRPSTRGLVFAPPPLGVLLTYLARRWKLWNEKEAAVEVSHSDATESYTAACFGGDEEKSESFIALGCSSGRIQAWGTRSGELVGPVATAFHALARGADCSVSALAASSSSNRGRTVFAACAGVPEILEVSIVDGTTRASFRADKAGSSHLALGGLEGEYLLSAGAGSALKLWAVSDIGAGAQQPSARRRLAASGANPSCIDITGATSGGVLALCCDGALQVDVFSCDGESSKSVVEADLVLSGQDRIWTARFLSAQTQDGLIVVAGCGAATASLWSFAPPSLKRGGSKTVTPVLAVSSDDLGGRILCARPSTGSSSSSTSLADATSTQPCIFVAYGNSAQPLMAEVRSASRQGDAASIHRIGSGAAKSASSTKKAGSATQGPAPTILGPIEAAAAQRHKRAAPEEAEAAEKRAKLLEQQEGIRVANAGALSVAPVIRQALRTKDRQAMEKVLIMKDRRAIDSTVAELSGSEAFDVLQECTAMLFRASAYGSILCAWINCVLVHHGTFIGSQPQLRASLGPLHEACKVRLTMHRPLVKLRWRLRMARNLGNEVLQAQQGGTVADGSKDAQAPLVEYVEGHSDAEEEEDDEEDEAGDEGSEDEEGGFSDLWADESDDE